MDVTPTDAQNVADLRLAATGDASAQLRLSRTARDLVLAGVADDIVGSIEGVNFARLAAAQGVPDALVLLSDHCAHLGQAFAECGEHDASDNWIGQSLAMLELAAEVLPAANAAALMDSLNIAADNANAAIMQAAKEYRAIFAPAFGAAAFA